jgi:hypothetical protein
MGTKHNDSCLTKAADNEPIFVLRAQDMYADGLVDLWADKLSGRLGRDHPKVVEARKLASDMRAWPKRKLPD